MRVAEISTFSQYSVGNIMNDIKSELIRKGHSCKIFYFRGDTFGDIRIGKKIDIYINALIARFTDNDGFCLKKNTLTLISKLEEYNPDIIHIHCLHGYAFNSMVLFNYFKRRNKKIVWTMHDNWAITGHCAYADLRDCNKWESCCYNCAAKHDYPKSFFDYSKRNYLRKKRIFTSLLEDEMLIVSPSRWLDNIISKSYLNKYHHIVINNGIDSSLFKDYHMKRKKTILCVASVWDERKNIRDILLLAKKNFSSWNFIIIGKILQHINEKEYPNIRFIPRTSNRNEIVKMYNECKVLLNPSLADNFPTVNIEAQLCGMKVIAYDIGGNKETDLGNLFIVGSIEKITEEYLDNICALNNDIEPYNYTKESMAKLYIEKIEDFYYEK